MPYDEAAAAAGEVMRSIAIAALVLALFSALARADEAALTPAQVAQLKSENLAVLARSKDTDGVFAVQDDATVRHLQSGLICPARYPNVTLYSALSYPEAGKGQDVGCDYRRADDKGGANAKLTVFAVKTADGATLETEFAKYRNEVVQTYKDANPQGPALEIKDEGANKLPPIRSEEFVIGLNGRDYTTQLIVAVKNGWTIEIRATFTGRPNELTLDEGHTVADAVDWTADRAMAATTLFVALGSIGE